MSATARSDRYAIEFRSGTYFVNVDRPNGGTRDEALRFENRGAAEAYMRLSWLTWIAANGGMVVDLGEEEAVRS
jgi:hypothetical protein